MRVVLYPSVTGNARPLAVSLRAHTAQSTRGSTNNEVGSAECSWPDSHGYRLSLPPPTFFLQIGLINPTSLYGELRLFLSQLKRYPPAMADHVQGDAASYDPRLIFASLTPEPEDPHTTIATRIVFDKILSQPQAVYHHVKFIQTNPGALLACRSPGSSPELPSLSSSFSTEVESPDDNYEEEEDRSRAILGCYFFSLAQSLVPRDPHRGWVFGKGGLNSRGEEVEVDLLLPHSADTASKAETLVWPEHGRFAFDSNNQQLYLHARHEGVRVDDREIRPRSKILLRHRAHIRIGSLRFIFEYKVKDENEELVQNVKKLWIYNNLDVLDPLSFTSPTPSKNDLIIDGWLLNGVVGATPTSVIYTATHERNGQLFAAKRLRLDRNNYSTQSKRATLELAIYQSITEGLRGHRYSRFVMRRHSLLQNEHSHNTVREVYMLWEPLVKGDFDRFGRDGDWFDTPDDLKKRFFVQICLGVQALHSIGWIHRDLKPGNVGVASFFTSEACVLDLGGAVEVVPGGHEPKMFTCGTIAFMAPELENSKDAATYGTKADVWSLGAIAYFLFCGGKIPWSRTYNMFAPTRGDQDPSLVLFRRIRSKLLRSHEDSLNWLIGAMLTENPSNRPQIKGVLNHKAFRSIREQIDLEIAADSQPNNGKRKTTSS